MMPNATSNTPRAAPKTERPQVGKVRELRVRRINRAAFENLANLDALPATGATLVALPMKVAHGSGGPLRAVAFLPADP